ncbi:DUF4179 domain-containing protein [Candidatus Clostridium stratigraminis]|uniref:DUF4179 domain-containing protein n=1 Tax=Candidatus Clostridium stratigraminis TaxID=3381661 RepID=A0ABW8T7I6_9CLOT
MDKDLLIDDILKEKAISENIILPKELDMKIKETIINLPERKKQKSKFIKRTAAAAIITIATATCLCVAFPAYARSVPVVSSVFQFLSDRNLIDRDYIAYSSDLNLSRTSNGVTVTINNIAYDGIDLSIGYTVESKEEMKDMPHMLDKEFRINGMLTSFGSRGTGQLINKNTYVGVDSFHVAKDYLPKEIQKQTLGGNVTIPDTFIMDLKIKEFSNKLKGNWDFKFKVSKEKIKEKVKDIKTSIDLSSLRPGLKVNEIVFTPINTALRSVENNAKSYEMVNYLVIDEKGRILSAKGATGSGSDEINRFYWEYTFRNIYEDTKSVTFIPSTYTKYQSEKIKNSNGSWENDKKDVLLDINKTTVLSQGKLGDYKITQVEFLNDKTVIHYECNGLIAAIQPYGLTILDSQGKEYPLSKEVVTELGNNKFVAYLEPLSFNKMYKLSAVDYEKVYDIREDLKFTIDVK